MSTHEPTAPGTKNITKQNCIKRRRVRSNDCVTVIDTILM